MKGINFPKMNFLCAFVIFMLLSSEPGLPLPMFNFDMTEIAKPLGIVKTYFSTLAAVYFFVHVELVLRQKTPAHNTFTRLA